MALAPGDLVDRDVKQIAEPVLAEHLFADALDDPPDRLPVDPRQPAGRGLVGLGRQPGDEVLEVAREAGAVTGERDALHAHAMFGATNPPQLGVNLQAPTAEIQVPPDRVVMLLVLAVARGVRALRAMKATAAQRDRDHHMAGLEADRPNPHPRQIEQARECARDAHRRRPPVRSVQKPRTYGPNLCASLPPSPPPRKQRRNAAQTQQPAPAYTPNSPTIIHGASKIRRQPVHDLRRDPDDLLISPDLHHPGSNHANQVHRQAT